MLLKKFWLGMLAAVAVVSLGALVGGCGDSVSSLPKELQGQWVTVDKNTGEETVLDLSSGSFESMPVNSASYLAKKAAETRLAYYDDDVLWVERCAIAATKIFTDGYITVGMKGKSTANKRSITLEITHIYGGFWNDIWKLTSSLMKCALLHVMESVYSTIPGVDISFLYDVVNNMFNEMLVPLSNKWYSRNDLLNETKKSMEKDGKDKEYIDTMLDMIKTIFSKQTIPYSLDDTGDVLKLMGENGEFQVYERVKIGIE